MAELCKNILLLRSFCQIEFKAISNLKLSKNKKIKYEA